MNAEKRIGQLVKQAAELERDRDEARAEVEKLRSALQLIEDMPPMSGMDPNSLVGESRIVWNVHLVARKALAATEAP